MFTRNVVFVFSLFILLVEGDLDSNDAGIQVISSDKDLTTDEALTETMIGVSPDQPEPAAAAVNSVEEEDEKESSDSKERGKKFSSRSAKPQIFVQLQQLHLHIQQRTTLPPVSPAHIIQRPTLQPQPIVPQPKAQVRSRTSKRRSRNNRRQI